jgi:Protein of unknown function (DUF1524)
MALLPRMRLPRWLRRRRRRTRLGAVLVAVALGVGGCVLAAQDTPPPAKAQPTANQIAAARTQIGQLAVAPARGGGYQRTNDFGPAWVLDADHNGCRQRDDVLRRDLTAVQTKGRCIVTAGMLSDPYTGDSVQFTKSDAAEVQVDHVYPLGLAWRHGAARWPQQRRVEFANDLANLVATSAQANNRKSDHGPGEWLPPNHGFWCAYAVRYIGVAAKYGLSVSAPDRTALSTALRTCPASH